MAESVFKKHGLTETTPKSVMLGAGIVVKGLTFDTAWKYEKILGATNGGNKLSIIPELLELELDGKRVKTKGTTEKVGEEAKLETNLAEVTADNMMMAVSGKLGDGKDCFNEIISKEKIEENDYLENLAFIGYTLDDNPIIVLFDWALCTSGLDFEAKNKDQTTIKAVFDCYADMKQEDLTHLPYHIYTKQAV